VLTLFVAARKATSYGVITVQYGLLADEDRQAHPISIPVRGGR
jgi:hypothetical protein